MNVIQFIGSVGPSASGDLVRLRRVNFYLRVVHQPFDKNLAVFRAL
jgi:hypothetical protein